MREKVLKTERSQAMVCPGLMHWDVAAGLQLDVVRYGTIVEARIDDFEFVRRVRYGRETPLWGRYSIVRVKGEVTAVLKGSTPLGVAEFPIMTLAGQWGPLRVNSRTESKVGGWALLREWEIPAAPVGLVFLPTQQIVDNILLGCGESHFVPTIGEAGEAYLRDIRRIAKHLREPSAAPLFRQSADSAMVRDLAAGGGRVMGYYLAEHTAWRVALALLEELTAPGTISSLQLGIVEGLMRMRVLLRVGLQPADGWGDADDHEIERRLAHWAIFALLWGVDDGDLADALSAASFPVFSTVWDVLRQAAVSFPVGELEISTDDLDMATKRLDTPERQDDGWTPTIEAWLRGKRPEPTSWFRASLPTHVDFDFCLDKGSPSASQQLLGRRVRKTQ